MSVSKQTALVPQNPPGENDTNAGTKEDAPGGSSEEEVSEGVTQFLPPVMGLKVEVKGLVTAEPSVPSKASNSPLASSNPSSGQGSPRTPKLPPLITSQLSSPPQKQPSGTSSGTSLKSSTSPNRKAGVSPVHKTEETREGGEGGGPQKEKSPRKISIVSLGESESGPRSRSSWKRRHSSGNQSARLSLGWSTPQTITEPLKGSSMLHPKTTPTGRKTTDNNKRDAVQNDFNDTTIPERALSPNMLNVNVSQVLIDAEQMDDT